MSLLSTIRMNIIDKVVVNQNFSLDDTQELTNRIFSEISMWKSLESSLNNAKLKLNIIEAKLLEEELERCVKKNNEEDSSRTIDNKIALTIFLRDLYFSRFMNYENALIDIGGYYAHLFFSKYKNLDEINMENVSNFFDGTLGLNKFGLLTLYIFDSMEFIADNKEMEQELLENE